MAEEGADSSWRTADVSITMQAWLGQKTAGFADVLWREMLWWDGAITLHRMPVPGDTVLQVVVFPGFDIL